MSGPPLTRDELLAGHAAGSLPAPLALVVATHLALSPASRRLYHCFEAAGGVLLEGIAPAPLAPDAWQRICGKLGEEERMTAPPRPPVPGALRRIPRPLRDHIPGSLGRLRWWSIGEGAAEAELDLGAAGYRTTMIHVRAGRFVPQHVHEGNELTLVIEGSFHDELGWYRRGDLAIANPSVDHRPTADENCLCLAVTDAGRRLTDPPGSLLNPFLQT